MVKLEIIYQKGSPNNPLGQEVVLRAAKRLVDLKYNPDGIKKAIAGLSCSDESHVDFENKVIINDELGNVLIEACCDSFKESIEQAMKQK